MYVWWKEKKTVFLYKEKKNDFLWESKYIKTDWENTHLRYRVELGCWLKVFSSLVLNITTSRYAFYSLFYNSRLHVISHEWSRFVFVASAVCFVWDTKPDFPRSSSLKLSASLNSSSLYLPHSHGLTSCTPLNFFSSSHPLGVWSCEVFFFSFTLIVSLSPSLLSASQCREIFFSFVMITWFWFSRFFSFFFFFLLFLLASSGNN